MCVFRALSFGSVVIALSEEDVYGCDDMSGYSFCSFRLNSYTMRCCRYLTFLIFSVWSSFLSLILTFCRIFFLFIISLKSSDNKTFYWTLVSFRAVVWTFFLDSRFLFIYSRAVSPPKHIGARSHRRLFESIISPSSMKTEEGAGNNTAQSGSVLLFVNKCENSS